MAIIREDKERLERIEELGRIADIAFKGRQRLRKRDADRLLAMSTDTVGLACKAMAAVDAEVETPDDMTDEAWNAYDLLIHLVYSDWEESEVMAYGRTPDVCQNDN